MARISEAYMRPVPGGSWVWEAGTDRVCECLCLARPGRHVCMKKNAPFCRDGPNLPREGPTRITESRKTQRRQIGRVDMQIGE